MFEGLTSKLQNVFKKLTGYGKLTEKNIADAMREVRLALLEADVNFKVVKDFVKSVSEKAVGIEVLRSIKPGQQVIKIVQGSGKTTTAGKLANYLRKKGRNPLLVACDPKRPAAIEQLKVVGKQLTIPVFTKENEINAVKIAIESLKYAEAQSFDTVILDTAGRLHVDDELMGELKGIKDNLKPKEMLLIADAMTGQDAVNIAEKFNSLLDISGTILTKLDGDTRGGAALSIRAVTGKPIKFAGIGEKLGDLEPFHADRMASRILGMGDVLTLVEKVQEQVTEEQAKKLEEKIRKQSLNLEDYLVQLQQLKKMGSFESILKMLPGMSQLKDLQIDEHELVKVEAIIKSMTPEERRNPNLLNANRRNRVAKGSGTAVHDVNKLLKGFEQAKRMMKDMSKMQKGMLRLGGLKWQ
jgi:signal recognition particle subunit SRP54